MINNKTPWSVEKVKPIVFLDVESYHIVDKNGNYIAATIKKEYAQAIAILPELLECLKGIIGRNDGKAYDAARDILAKVEGKES